MLWISSSPKIKNRRGASVVELGLVAPFFIILCFGVVEFGRAVMVKQSLTDAARAGARTAALATTNNIGKAEESARTYLRQTLSDSFDLSLCRITITPGSLENLQAGAEIQAAVAVDFNDVSWITPTFLSTAEISGEASMTKE